MGINKTILFCDNSLRELINFRIEIINHYAALGYNVILLAPENRAFEPTLANIRFIPITLDRSGKNLVAEWKYFNTLRKIYKREKPDYIFHYTIKPNIYGTFAARLCRIHSSMMIAGLGYVFYKKGITNSIARGLYRLALAFTDYVIVLNVQNKEYLIYHKMAPPKKIIHLKGGEGVNLVRFKPDDCFNIVERPVFLMIARLLFDKGYSEYVKAAESIKLQYPYAEFQVLGDFDLSYPNHVPKESVEQDNLKGTIHYLGYCQDVVEKIKKATCIVLPSSYNEGLSRVLMEALAMGKIIITTDIPGCREMVDEGENGFVVPIKDPIALAGAMRKVLEMDAESVKRVGIYSRKKAEKIFDVNNVIQVYNAITVDVGSHK